MPDCDEDQEYNETVGGCVPMKPAPFQAVEIEGRGRWLWDPARDEWVKMEEVDSSPDDRRIVVLHQAEQIL